MPKQKKLTDVVFTATINQLGDEVGALLGQPLTCSDLELRVISKNDFFANYCMDKSILTHMKVTGDREGLGFLLVQVPDAIIMGGTLIMLPEDQIEEQRQAGDFDGEVADSFGEIANIISGSLTQVFLDRYPKQIRYIKTEMETLVPTKIDMASDQPFPEGKYYLASFALGMEGHELSRAHLIFPAEIFDLQDEASEQSSAAEQPAAGEWGGAPSEAAAAGSEAPAPGGMGRNTAHSRTGRAGSTSSAPPQQREELAGDTTTSAAAATREPLVLIISDQQDNATPFVDILTSAGYKCQVLSYQDEIRGFFQQHQIVGIFLIMGSGGRKRLCRSNQATVRRAGTTADYFCRSRLDKISCPAGG